MKWKTWSTCTVTRNRWGVPAAKHGWFASDLPSLPVCKMHQCAMPKQINPRKSRLLMLRCLKLLLSPFQSIRDLIFHSSIYLDNIGVTVNVPLDSSSPYHSIPKDKTAIDLFHLRDKLADNRSKWYVSLASFFHMIRSIHREIKLR